MATEGELRAAEIAAAEARTDTKIARLEGKLDLVLSQRGHKLASQSCPAPPPAAPAERPSSINHPTGDVRHSSPVHSNQDKQPRPTND
jgi:hypothetical protein